ncbi:MAG: VCBS repeat-containing protein [bacterium]|nr:VCBS repeat-containing protein [bacterium]
MNKRIKQRLILALLVGVVSLSVSPVEAQYTRSVNPFPVVDIDGDTLALAFYGGLNDPKPMLLDFDHDNLTDLMIGQPNGKVSYFKNTGTASVAEFSFVDEYLGQADVGTWFTFCDIDADNDFDLFGDARNGGVIFYENQSVGATISFVLQDTLFSGFLTGFNNTSAFADIDNDNDYDFFFGALTGYLEFYRNDGDSANYSFSLIDDAYDSVYAFPGGNFSKNPNHGFSNILFQDLDSDNDLDLFWGDIFNQNAYFFENLGSPEISDLTHVTDDFLPVSTAGFNHLTFADLDDDLDVDLVLGVANSSDIDNLSCFRNDGTPSAPLLVQVSANMLDAIDHISAAVPALGDIDADNDLDLLVGAFNGQLAYYENVGDKLSPAYTLIDSSYQSIDVGNNSAPFLVDWDQDNDLDLLIGNSSGRIEYWRNDGNASNFVPVQITNQLEGIKVDQLATPRAVDLNNDGLLDLVVGEWDFNAKANLLLYENVGTSGSPSLSLVTKALLPIENRDFTIPTIIDWDGNGTPDIILSGRTEGMQLWLNQSATSLFPDSTTLALSSDSIPGNSLGERLVPAFADLDFDGDDDLLLGEQNGGLNFFWKNGSCCVGDRGNANGDPMDALDISDLTYMVDYLFGGGPPPICFLEANFDANPEETIDITDLTTMVDYFFAGSGLIFPCP